MYAVPVGVGGGVDPVSVASDQEQV